MSSFQHPFHRLLSFFAHQGRVSRSTSTATNTSTTTITLLDSLKGDLALGFNLPLSVILSLGRHLVFRTSSGLSIHIPSVSLDWNLLGGPGAYSFDENKRYTLSELRKQIITQNGSLKDQLDAIGIWTVAAKRQDGKIMISGKDLKAFQEGTVLEGIAKRRRGRDDILPFWRGGPIS
jgi:hypothetical protein